MKRFSGKNAIITGAASGIGKATAERLAAEGANIVVADINVAQAREVAAAVEASYGVKAHGIGFDAADAQQCRHLVDSAVELVGALDVVVNNAGIVDWSRADEYAEDRWDRVLKINLYSVFIISKYAIPHLKKTSGCIVNMSSSASLAGVPYHSAYCAAKGGVNAMTRSMAVEYADQGIRFNAVCPGGVDTPLNKNTALPEWADMAKLMRLAPKIGRMSKPEEIAAAVAYLASSDAGSVTGATLSVDGGQTAG